MTQEQVEAKLRVLEDMVSSLQHQIIKLETYYKHAVTVEANGLVDYNSMQGKKDFLENIPGLLWAFGPKDELH
jgi:hypothetical protein